ncbi:Propionyl-CoA carboxylase [Acidimicrobium ferrooxidans DSM 10331]|uniref:Propionyl-CoA carboxylase n=2 Tax=Acidimicrobium ferrooxidans TaxID=53635 RepID=C7LZ11_ACIFD|nr:carboxyl transferase domain-containing protein [Acidimicrobium ferrooxidans]ACU53969.1 Propionyl-CoA carboxylase [Acidimicrobium ferrooxidans DSM 10331]
MAAPILERPVDPRDPGFVANRAAMVELVEQLESLLDQAALGGGAEAHARRAARGLLGVRERVGLLVDPESPFLELSPLAGYGTEYRLGGAMVLGIGVVEGTECVIVANDPSDLGGALTQISVRKLLRGLEIARANRMPLIQLVESAGGDLRGFVPGDDPDAALRRNLEHFATSGRMFHDITTLSAEGIPTIAVVFGSSTAGGAYQPGLSDYTILVRDRAKVFLGGPPLVRMATGELSSDEELGGAEMHATVSGLADYLARDELDAIRSARSVVAHLQWRKAGPGPVRRDPRPPRYDPEELLGLMPIDLRGPVDMRAIIARIVDDSRFEEFKPSYGPTLITGWAEVHGFAVGIVANDGVLLSEASAKGAQFIQLCNQRATPLVFLQHITGFMVGSDYERSGIIKHGSQLINAVSNSTVPHVTIILGASYGAGNYAMSGQAFDTRFVFAWPTARIAIMGPTQMAGVMSIVRHEQAARRGVEIDEEAEAVLRSRVEAFAHAQSLALYATGRVADDGVIDPRDTRDVVGMALSACHSAPVIGARGYGVFRL